MKSHIDSLIPTKNYTMTCKCGGIIDVKKMIAVPSLKEGWLATCRKCKAISGVKEFHVEAEGAVITNALEWINDIRDEVKKLKVLKEARKNGRSSTI